MAYRFTARSTTPGDYRLASGTLGQLVALSDIRLNVNRGDGGLGTLDPEAAGYTYGDEDPSLVLSTAAGHTEASVVLANYTLISGVVAAQYVISGHDNYTGGDAGTYHVATTGEVKDGVTFGALEAETGTYSPGGTFAEGQADQLATDQAAVALVSDSILDSVTGLLTTVDGEYPVDIDTGGSAAVYLPVCVADFDAETTWNLYTRGLYGSTLGYKIGLTKFGNVHVIGAIYEGVARPAWYAAYAPDASNSVGSTTHTGENTKYWTLDASGDWIEWTVAAAGNGADRLVIGSVNAAGQGTADVVLNAGLAGETVLGQVVTAGTINYRASTTLTLATPLATGDTIRLRWAAGNSTSARITGIYTYCSTAVAAAGDAFAIPVATNINESGSSVEHAYAIAPSGSATKWFGGSAHQIQPNYCSEINPVSTWLKDGAEWTPAVGWTAGTFENLRVSDVAYDATPTLIGTLRTRYRLGPNYLDVQNRFKATVELTVGTCYVAMWTALNSASDYGEPTLLFGDGTFTEIQTLDDTSVFAVTPAAARRNMIRYTPGGATVEFAIVETTNPIATAFVMRRDAPDNDDKVYFTIAPNDAAGTVWGGAWRVSFSAMPVLPLQSVVETDSTYGVAGTELTGTLEVTGGAGVYLVRPIQVGL